MVETAELRDGDDFASGGWQYWTGLQTILVKREMSSRLVIQLSNPTHKIPSLANVSIFGILGTVVRWVRRSRANNIRVMRCCSLQRDNLGGRCNASLRNAPRPTDRCLIPMSLEAPFSCRLIWRSGSFPKAHRSYAGLLGSTEDRRWHEIGRRSRPHYAKGPRRGQF